ncbi:hypothetical protein P8C59_009368 [Phyllachora maydis]|uniref:Siderophore biosynthesis n=1 Tax=Phyllachora maydis TaxID=1825666 RepID=A0AAD9ID00_9PEZI|nr:hypothetical protein P8C59_009368 [Phyllachora maydis]
MSSASKLLAGLALVAPAVVLARTDLSGCVSTSTVVSTAGSSSASVIWYVPGTGEICAIPDCGGGRAPAKTTQPGCAGYTGTATLTPSYLSGVATVAATATGGHSSPAVATTTPPPRAVGADATSCTDDDASTYTAGFGGAQVLSLNTAMANGATIGGVPKGPKSSTSGPNKGNNVYTKTHSAAAAMTAPSSAGQNGNATMAATPGAQASDRVQASGAKGVGMMMAKGVAGAVIAAGLVAMQAML